MTISVWNLEAEDKGNSTESTPSRNVPTYNNQVFFKSSKFSVLNNIY